MRENEKKTIISRMLPVFAFIAMIGLGTGFSLLKPDSDFSAEENRDLAQAPKLSVDAVKCGDFQAGYETYLSDQFVARGTFVQVKSTIQRWLGRRDMNGVYFGSGGYLLEQYRDSDFNRQTIDDNAWFTADFLSAMQEEYGKGHVFAMFIPSKGTVLKERFPIFQKPYDTSYVPDMVAAYLREDYDLSADLLVDLSDTLEAHGDEYIYYRTDHHWTTLGAYYAYAKYKELYRESARKIDDYEKKDTADDFYGTTYDKVQVKTKADVITSWTPKGSAPSVTVDFDRGEKVWDSFYSEEALKEKDKYQYFFGGNYAQVHIHTQTGNRKTLLLLKDSYSNSFVEFAAEDYEDIYMVDLRYTNDNIYDIMEQIEEENPITDVLVMYNIEKFMNDNNLEQLEMQD